MAANRQRHWIREICEQTGVTQKVLAESLSKDPRELYKWGTQETELADKKYADIAREISKLGDGANSGDCKPEHLRNAHLKWIARDQAAQSAVETAPILAALEGLRESAFANALLETLSLSNIDDAVAVIARRLHGCGEEKPEEFLRDTFNGLFEGYINEDTSTEDLRQIETLVKALAPSCMAPNQKLAAGGLNVTFGSKSVAIKRLQVDKALGHNMTATVAKSPHELDQNTSLAVVVTGDSLDASVAERCEALVARLAELVAYDVSSIPDALNDNDAFVAYCKEFNDRVLFQRLKTTDHAFMMMLERESKDVLDNLQSLLPDARILENRVAGGDNPWARVDSESALEGWIANALYRIDSEFHRRSPHVKTAPLSATGTSDLREALQALLNAAGEKDDELKREVRDVLARIEQGETSAPPLLRRLRDRIMEKTPEFVDYADKFTKILERIIAQSGG